MAEIARVSVKMPRLRIAVAGIIVRILNPFVRSEATGERIGAALFAWVKRGVRVYADGRRL